MNKIRIKYRTVKIIDYSLWAIAMVFAFFSDWKVFMAFIFFDIMRGFEILASKYPEEKDK